MLWIAWFKKNQECLRKTEKYDLFNLCGTYLRKQAEISMGKFFFFLIHILFRGEKKVPQNFPIPLLIICMCADLQMSLPGCHVLLNQWTYEFDSQLVLFIMAFLIPICQFYDIPAISFNCISKYSRSVRLAIRKELSTVVGNVTFSGVGARKAFGASAK